MTDVSDIRTDYARNTLDDSDVLDDPFEQFDLWMQYAINSKVPEPNAMTITTVDASGQPSARIVLLRGYDESGLKFYTNYESQKGTELATNPLTALLFFWPTLERQVRVAGRIEKVPRSETEAYFATRPRSSQLGAWASRQSEPINSRSELEESLLKITDQFDGQDVPAPPHWGGYCVTPHSFEFWQGRPGRLHDRVRYTRTLQNNDETLPTEWTRERLSP